MGAKERFYEVMDSLGLNDYKVYTQIDGITKNMMAKLRQGATNEVSTKILMPFCSAYQSVNANYILTGRGSMFNTEPMSLSSELVDLAKDIDLNFLQKAIDEYIKENKGKPKQEIVIINKEDAIRAEEMFANVEEVLRKLAEGSAHSKKTKIS